MKSSDGKDKTKNRGGGQLDHGIDDTLVSVYGVGLYLEGLGGRDSRDESADLANSGLRSEASGCDGYGHEDQQPHGFQQPFDRCTDARIIINNEHISSVDRNHAGSATEVGSVNLKHAPRPELLIAHRRPP